MNCTKRMGSGILILVFCIQLAFPGILIPVRAENENGILQFSDDFSGGMGNWKTDHQGFHPIGEEPALYSDSLNYCSAAPAGGTTCWRAATVTMRVRFSKANSGAMFWLTMRQKGQKFFTAIIRVGSEQSFRYYYNNGSVSASERLFSGENYAVRNDTEYDLKFVNTDERTDAYIKRTDETAYTFAGSAEAAFSESGSVSITSGGVIAAIKDFKIYNDEPGTFYFEKKIVKAKTGATACVAPVNRTGQNSDITYTSQNPECVSVDADGTLHFKKSGKAVITATATDGNEEYQDCFDAFCYDTIDIFGFNGSQRTLYIGEVLNLCAVMRPDNIENKRIKWSCSNDNAEVIGNLDNEKTIKAKKAGDCVITIQSMEQPDLKRTFTVTVIPPPDETLSARFFEGRSRKIPQYFFGMHQSPLDGIGTTKDKQKILDREKQFSGYYDELHVDFTRFMLNTFDWKTGRFRETTSAYPSYTLQNIYTAGNLSDIPYMIVAADTDTADDIVGMVKEIRKVTKNPIFIEMGNETYSLGAYGKYFPTIESFTDRVKEAYPKIKAIDSNIKVAIPIMGYSGDDSDPNTPAGRVAKWDESMLTIKDYCDAVVFHAYSGTNFWEMKSTSDIMNGQAQQAKHELNTAKSIYERFGKEIWISEYGDLPYLFNFANDSNDSKYYAPQSESERARLQYAKSAGNAVSYATRLMNFLNNENITMASYHYFNDMQGFGVIQDDTKLPSWYTFKELGKLLHENEYYHQMTVTEDNKITAYGFGDAKNTKKIVFSNMTNQSASASVGAYRLKKIWSYGGSNPLPDYGIYTDSYTSLPSVIPQPVEYTDEKPSDDISLQPYSITVAEVIDEEKFDEPDIDICFQNGTEQFEGVTVSRGSITDGKFVLNNYSEIATEQEFGDSVIEFDYQFTNGKRLDILFNIQKDSSGKPQYYNHIYFGTGKKLYDTFRMLSSSPEGKMWDNPFLSNHEIELFQNIRYRIKIVKKAGEVSFYVMNRDAENPEYVFCGKLTGKLICNLPGTVVIQSAANSMNSLIPYGLRIYDLSSAQEMYVQNVTVASHDNITDVSCDVYSFAASENAKAIAAVYDDRGKLTGVSMKDVGYSKDKTSIQFNPIHTGSKIKIFVWNQEMTKSLTRVLEQ